jgi:hypothetical protein
MNDKNYHSLYEKWNNMKTQEEISAQLPSLEKIIE